MNTKAIILGAGPAGLAAAIQLQRSGLQPLVLEANRPGGLLWNANLVENYPAFPQGIPGPELVCRMLDQATQLGVRILPAAATSLSWQEGRFQVTTRQAEFTADYLVIATGTRPRLFTDFAIPPELSTRVGYEVYPLRHWRSKTIAIVGAGDAAFDYALNLAQHNFVLVLNRSTEHRGLPLLWQRLHQHPAIHYHTQVQIRELQPLPGGRIRLKCENLGDLTVDYLLGALGREPAVDFIGPEFQQQTAGCETEGRMFWIGDVVNGRYRQTAIAVGDGLRAAMKILEAETRRR